jgi:hypothetical protein
MANANTNDNIELCDRAELQERPQRCPQRAEFPVADVVEQEGGEAEGQSLLPCDGGRAAWRLLMSAFIFEALLWGILISTFLCAVICLNRTCR